MKVAFKGRPIGTTCALLLAVSSPARARADDLIGADRPGLANASSTVGQGRFQVEAGAYWDHTSDGDARGFATPILLRYGVRDAFELRVESAGYQRTDSGAGPTDGWSPVSLGFKYRIAEENGGRPAASLVGRVFPASGSGEFRSDRTTGDLVLTADKSLGGHWAVNPNLGVAWGDDGGRFTSILAALTVQYGFTPAVGVFVDGAWQHPEAPDAGSAEIIDLGGAWIIGRDTQLDLSFGWGVRGETVPGWFGSAGVSRRF
jgi:hypothetical protein